MNNKEAMQMAVKWQNTDWNAESPTSAEYAISEANDVINALIEALALAEQPAQPQQEPINLLRYEPEIFREDRIRMELDCNGDWVKYADAVALIAQSPQPAQQQEPVARVGLTDEERDELLDVFLTAEGRASGFA